MSRARRRTVKGLVILGSVLAFLSVFAIWTERQALNTDDWVTTSGRLIQNETIRTALSDYLVDQLYENVDVEAELKDILPGDTKDLAGPAAGGLRQVAGQGAEKVLETSTAQSLWEDANRSAHEQLVSVLEDKGEAVSTSEGNVSLNLGSLLTNLASQVGIGQNLAEKLPADAGQIEILHSDELKTAQNIAVAIKGLALLLSILTFIAFAAAIYLSRDGRWVTVLYSGIGLVAAGFAVIVFREIARRDRRRPAGQDRERQARRRSRLVDRHLADDQHRDHGDRRRHPLRDRRLARLADRLGPSGPPHDRADPAPPRRLRLHRPGDHRLPLLPLRRRSRACAPSSPPWSSPAWPPSASTSCASRPRRSTPTPSYSDVFGDTRDKVVSAVKDANIGERVGEQASKLRLPEKRPSARDADAARHRPR